MPVDLVETCRKVVRLHDQLVSDLRAPCAQHPVPGADLHVPFDELRIHPVLLRVPLDAPHLLGQLRSAQHTRRLPVCAVLQT